MNSFTAASKIEKLGKERWWKKMNIISSEWRECVDKEENMNCGDCLCIPLNEYHEWKFEEEDRYGNFYFETYSNKSKNFPGWMFKNMKAQFLWYGFLDTGKVYLFDFIKLKEWFKENYLTYKEKPQGKYVQNNDTWGRPVSIKVMKELGFIIEEFDF
jgi:hypothetical protein